MNNNNENLINFPNYKDIIKEITNQLAKRSGLIAKRTLLISWPALIYIAILTILKDNEEAQNFALNYTLIVTPLVLIYTVAFSHLFGIEKNIWIDSFFDHKNIDPKESLKIAKRLFWPSFIMKLRIFIRYYLLSVILLLFPLAYFFFILFRLLSAMLLEDNTFNVNPMNWSILFASLIIIPLIVWIYFYYLRIKLRYFWFIFLDSFGKTEFSFQMIVREMKKLNEINKSESFRKSLAVNVGANAARGIANFSIGTALMALRNLGKSGDAAANVAGVYSSELTDQLASYSKITGNYMLYRFTHHACYGDTQTANENIYKLSV